MARMDMAKGKTERGEFKTPPKKTPRSYETHPQLKRTMGLGQRSGVHSDMKMKA